MNVEINTDYSQYNNGKMNLQEIIDKYEARNKDRLMHLKIKPKGQLRTLMLSLYVETDEIINDLKQLL